MGPRSGDWQEQWDIEGTLQYVLGRSYKRVTLQFPDELLEHATVVAAELQAACKARGQPVQVYVLADTSYNSLSVDEVAAQHAAADCVIHYGRASLSALSRLPAYFVFGRQPLDTARVAARVSEHVRSTDASVQRAVVVLLDQPYTHAARQLRALLEQAELAVPVVVADVAATQLEPVTAQQSASPQPDSRRQQACCSSSADAAASSAETACQAGLPQATRQDGASGAEQPCTSLPGSAPSRQAHPGLHEPCCSAAMPANGSGPTHAANSSGHTCAAAQAQPRCCQQQPAEPDSARQPASVDTPHQNEHQGLNAQACSGRAAEGNIGGLVWQWPAGLGPDDCLMLWVGPDDAPGLLHLQLTFNSCQWVMHDPVADSWREGLPQDISRTLRKRYYLVEKAKNANIVGILVGTLGVAGYLAVAEKLRRLARAAGKKTYTVLMGKPNPAKLANFPEVEVFVMIADPQGMILDSKDFYAPIITPYEAQLAWAPEQREWTGAYRLDFADVLDRQDAEVSGQPEEPRFSLLTGGYHADDRRTDAAGLASQVSVLTVQDPDSLQLSTNGRADALVEVRSAAEYLAKRRSYTGLEAPMVGASPKPVDKAVQGRSGRAAHYDDEPHQRQETS